MKYCLLLLILHAASSFAGATFAPTAKEVNEVQKADNMVNKALLSTEVGNARLRVEGAQFKAFNLNLSPCIIGQAFDKKNAVLIREVIEKDLAITGNFNLMKNQASSKLENDALLKQKGVDGRSRCQLSLNGQKIRAVLEHKNLLSGKFGHKYVEAELGQPRRLAHLMAQSIFEEYIGPEDIFLLQIAAIKRHKRYNQVVLFDFDGFNESSVSSGTWNKACPAFTKDGKNMLYTVITDQGQAIIEQQIGKPNLVFRVKYPGLNLDPTVLPNDNGLLVTLSLGGYDSNIFKTTRAGTLIGKVTQNMGTNLSPDLSPDGKMIAFVSTRGGTPQIYEQALSDELGSAVIAKRLTMEGRFNQTPRYSPDGRHIVFTARDERQEFNIALIDRESKSVSYLTRHQGSNKEPVFSPSGRFVIFSSERGSHRQPEIYLATINGDHQYRLTTDGGYYSPIIRPKQP